MEQQLLVVSLVVLDNCPSSSLAIKNWNNLQPPQVEGSTVKIVKQTEIHELDATKGKLWSDTFPPYIKSVPAIVKTFGGLTEVFPAKTNPANEIDLNALNEWIKAPFVVDPFKPK